MAFATVPCSCTTQLSSQELPTGERPLEQNLGILLVDFFRLYGRVIDIDRIGVSAKDGGVFFGKDMWGMGREGRIAVVDPNCVDNNLTSGSYNIDKVSRAPCASNI